MNKNIKILLVISLIVNIIFIYYYFLQKNHQTTVPKTTQSVSSNDIKTNSIGEVANEVFKKIDLNGDEQIEDVDLRISYPGHETTLTIDDKSIVVPIENASGSLELVDINSKDKPFWVAVPAYGPSDDPNTAFYGWDGKNIINYGIIDGDVDISHITGDGHITANVRGKILQTWSHEADFILNKENKLVEKPRKFYEASWDQKLTLLTDFSLVKSPSDKNTVVVLHKGDVVKFIGCDEVTWCMLQTSNKVSGWFEMKYYAMISSINKDARLVFEGLNYAD